MSEPSLGMAEERGDGMHRGPSPGTAPMRVQHDVAPAALLKVGGALLAASALAGLFAFLLLWALRVPQPLALACLMAVANAIPMVGALLGTVPAVLVALTRSVPTALAVAAGYTLFLLFENQVLIPRIYSKSMQLSASAVIIAISMGATLMGILGAVLALPVAAAVRVVLHFVREWHDREEKAAARATPPSSRVSG